MLLTEYLSEITETISRFAEAGLIISSDVRTDFRSEKSPVIAKFSGCTYTLKHRYGGILPPHSQIRKIIGVTDVAGGSFWLIKKSII